MLILHRSCESKVSLTCSPRGKSSCFPLLPAGLTVPGAGLAQPAQGPWRAMLNAPAAHWGLQPLPLPVVSGQKLPIPHQDPGTSVCASSWHEPGFTEQFGPCTAPVQSPGKGFQLRGWNPPTPSVPSSLLQSSSGHLATALLLQPSGTASQLPPGQATIPLGRGGGGGGEGKKKGRKK